jgi:hypothetical protein
MSKSLFDWRAHLKVHPAAELFPLMSETELQELADDVVKNGMVEPIVIWRKDGDSCLIDGRNRLDALALAGLLGVDDKGSLYNVKSSIGSIFCRVKGGAGGDPYALAISLNAHRRHLTAEQKRDLIATLLKATPELSDRQLGKIAKASKNTAASVRSDLEGRGQIDHVAKRTDSKGRKQPAKKTTTKAKPKPVMTEAPVRDPARADPVAAAQASAARVADKYVGRHGEPVTTEVSAEASAAVRKIQNADLDPGADTSASPVVAALRQELAQAKDRIRELEASAADAWQHARRGVKFTSDQYRSILGILHPDAAVTAGLKEKHERAFKAFTDQLPEEMFREKKLDANGLRPLPHTVAGLDAAKRRATANRAAKRAANRAAKDAVKRTAAAARVIAADPLVNSIVECSVSERAGSGHNQEVLKSQHNGHDAAVAAAVAALPADDSIPPFLDRREQMAGSTF